MYRRWIVAIVLLAAVAAPAPAAALEDDIKVTLEERRVENLSPEGLDLVFYLNLENVSSRDYALSGYMYRFVIQEQEYFRLPERNLDSTLSLPRGSKEMVRFPVRITYELLHRSIAGIQDAASVSCYIMGELMFMRGRRRGGALPFAFSAEFPLFHAPTVSVFAVKAQSITIGGAELQVELRVSNPNGFSFDVDSLEYDLKIGGHPLKQGRLSSSTPVAASSSLPLVVPLLFSFYEVGNDVHGLLMQETVSCQVSGTLSIRTEWGNLSLPYRLDQRVPVQR
jgi:LEA14-like dessication related protein